MSRVRSRMGEAAVMGPAVLGVGLSVALHMVWALWPMPGMPTGRETPQVSMTLETGPRSAVWSPTLFSLPTAIGFSGATGKDAAVVLPPLESPLELNARAEFDPREVLGGEASQRLIGGGAWPALTPFAMAAAEERAPAGFGWTLRGEEGDAPRIRVFREPRPLEGERSVRVSGVMEFDRYGQVTGLWVDPPGPPERERGEILHALRLVRISRGDGPVRMRFRLAWEPREVGR